MSQGQLNAKAYKGQVDGDPGYSYDDKYIWGAKEILDMSDLYQVQKDKYLEFIHQIRGYKTAGGNWNIVIQAMIQSLKQKLSFLR